MPEGQTCAWCNGIGKTYDDTCGWCDGSGIQKASFHGGDGQQEHRTCGPIRAWCYGCKEWCYRAAGDMFCGCCREAASVSTNGDGDGE